MKFGRFLRQGRAFYGQPEGDTVKELAALPTTSWQLTGRRYSLADVTILPPCQPTKVLAMALNYRSHLGQATSPSKPELFFKPISCLIGHGQPILLPAGSERIDAEGELVVVMGKRAQKVSERDALDYVLGYTCGNDVSARDWQRGDLQWWRAKGTDTFGPVGPFIETELDPSNVQLETRINGQVVQHATTSHLLFGIPTVISTISQAITLEPGDIIFTGTPGEPGQLHPGDTVEVEIEGIGLLRNPVLAG